MRAVARTPHGSALAAPDVGGVRLRSEPHGGAFDSRRGDGQVRNSPGLPTASAGSSTSRELSQLSHGGGRTAQGRKTTTALDPGATPAGLQPANPPFDRCATHARTARGRAASTREQGANLDCRSARARRTHLGGTIPWDPFATRSCCDALRPAGWRNEAGDGGPTSVRAPHSGVGLCRSPESLDLRRSIAPLPHVPWGLGACHTRRAVNAVPERATRAGQRVAASLPRSRSRGPPGRARR